MRRWLCIVFLPVLLFGAPAKKGASKPTQLIVLDPGHGGEDFGTSCHNTDEKSLTLSTAMLTKKYLQQKGYKVIMTRARDVFISLKERVDIANKTRGVLFLSFHFNAAKSIEATGIEIFYHDKGNKWRTRSSKKLAECALARMLHHTKAVSRGVKVANFHVIRETAMPAILIEGGFLTHPKERGKLRDLRYRDKLAQAIAEGVERYFSS